MDARASAKYLRGSPQKARLVVDMIRGKNVNEALAVLQYTNKRAADGIEKCLRSAVANATEAAEKANIAVDPDDLWVKAAFIDMGPTKNRRRMRPAPQGRAYKERRHFHHVTLLLSSDEQEALKGKRPSKAGKPQTTKPGKKLAAKTSAAPKAATNRAATKKPEPVATETPAAETTATTTGDEQATAE
ncbi:MAG TPA: 50S ribosomal protein L22 [Pyrinomonadaceae bacterium]|nr:50S ribosomal protein L22 [Pyrinomonadaceae bacterium]